jgi:hypothetical protein
VAKRARVGFLNEFELTDSGSSKFSMFSDAIGSEPVGVFDLLALLGDGNLIKEAGVAGEGFPVG